MVVLTVFVVLVLVGVCTICREFWGSMRLNTICATPNYAHAIPGSLTEPGNQQPLKPKPSILHPELQTLTPRIIERSGFRV